MDAIQAEVALGLGLAAVGYEDGGAGVGVEAERVDDALGALAGGVYIVQLQGCLVGDGLFETVLQVQAMFGEAGIGREGDRTGCL